jgi:peptidoglycan hydrolase-like protein with peptidoglycan-binding domain
MRPLMRTRFKVAYALAFVLVGFDLSAFAQGLGPAPSQPSFDCAKARSPLAVLICTGEETARADWDFRIASWARYFSLAENDRATFWEDQDNWLKSLNQKCRLTNSPPFSRQQTSCVIDAYRGRAALYRSKLTGDALAESRLTPEQLAKIQQALIALGFLEGETDSEFGSVTRAAIKNYQKANGFPQSDYLSMEQRRALLEGRADRSADAQNNARGDSAAGRTSPARQETPAGQPLAAGQPRAAGQQRAAGEFARLVEVPADCHIAREFGKSGRWKSQLFHLTPQVGRPGIQVPGPACQAAESCFQAMKSQAAAGVAYLTSNPAVSDALSSQLQAADPRSRSMTSITVKLQQLLATYSGTS